MKNFFNAIGVADMEKVHSAMIAWILDDENDLTLPSNNGQTISKFSTFPQKDRSKLLCNLFNVTPIKMFQSIKTCVEWNDIDILIETKDTNGSDEVWVIENKLKSQEHMSNEKDASGNLVRVWQTEKYANIIQNSFAKYNQHYVLLSLGGDTARCQTPQWEVCKYKDIYNYINRLLPSNSSYPLIQEYNNSIGCLITELTNFLKSPVNYGRVFDKKMTKADKARFLSNPNNLLCIERYILENGLETIFQKCYMGIIAKGIKYPYEIKDTHGNAMLNIDVTNSINWSTVKSKYPNNQLNAGIEFQNGTLKIQIHDMDNKIGNKAAFNKNWVSAFIKASGSPKNIYPSKNNGRYYVSKTYKKFNTWWGIKQPWNIIIKGCIAELQNAVNNH